ncbi:MAG TPA: hypothetical protein VFV92_12595 [Candidatus Bathyarchaeia archaeon]|nr:hypothetical protein [Candidatus Bathyarchaeia archaeon]
MSRSNCVALLVAIVVVGIPFFVIRMRGLEEIAEQVVAATLGLTRRTNSQILNSEVRVRPRTPPGISAGAVVLVFGACMVALAISSRVFSIARHHHE